MGEAAALALVLSGDGSCDFCRDTLDHKPPYVACPEHYEEARRAIQDAGIPTAEIELCGEISPWHPTKGCDREANHDGLSHRVIDPWRQEED